MDLIFYHQVYLLLKKSEFGQKHLVYLYQKKF